MADNWFKFICMFLSFFFFLQNFFVVQDNNFRIQIFFCLLILLTIWISFVCLYFYFIFCYFIGIWDPFFLFHYNFSFAGSFHFLYSFFFVILPAVQWSVFPTPSTSISTSSSSYRCELNFLFPLLITLFITMQNKTK